MSKQKNPWKRRLKRSAIGFVLLVGAALLANAFVVWRAGARVEARLTELRAAGEPTSIAELAPEPIAAERNAAAQLEAVRDRLDAFSRRYEAYYETPLAKTYDLGEGPTLPPTPEHLAAAREIVGADAELIAAVERAAACPEYASLLDYSLDSPVFVESLMDSVSQYRWVIRLQSWRVRIALAEENPDEAFRIALHSLKLAKQFEGEPTLVSYLISIACKGVAIDDLNRILRLGSVTVAQRKKLDGVLNELEAGDALGRMLATERAFGLDAIGDWGLNLWGQGARYRLEMLRWYDRVLAPGRLDDPTGSIPDPLDEVDAGWLEALMLPAIQSTRAAHHRGIATARCLRILNALQRYAEENGKEATGLTDLGLPADATTDPFTGEPLVCELRDGGWWIYTVMQDGKDDGGKFDDASDFGLAPIAADAAGQ